MQHEFHTDVSAPRAGRTISPPGRGAGGALVLALYLLLAGLAHPAGAQQAAAPQGQPGDGRVRSQHGDWQIVCKPPPPGAAAEVCAIVQSVSAEDRNNVGLTIYFQRFSNGTQVLRVFAPLGVLLPPGLGLKIDGADVGNAPFLRCHTFACYAQVTVEETLVKQLQAGKQAIFIIFQTEEAGIGIPISLSGFNEALKALATP
ncbi:MAG: invasion associated locus B family protein [Hyphomicrobiaceae bacterium]|nr:invasion associated locus B family protein [Hyphomicrobiaceae bacterium]